MLTRAQHLTRFFENLLARCRKSGIFSKRLIKLASTSKSSCAESVDELMARVNTLRERAVESGDIRDDVGTQDILNLISGTCHAAGHSGVDDQEVQRLVGIVIAGIQRPSAV